MFPDSELFPNTENISKALLRFFFWRFLTHGNLTLLMNRHKEI